MQNQWNLHASLAHNLLLLINLALYQVGRKELSVRAQYRLYNNSVSYRRNQIKLLWALSQRKYFIGSQIQRHWNTHL